jgi:hypothetical protein
VTVNYSSCLTVRVANAAAYGFSEQNLVRHFRRLVQRHSDLLFPQLDADSAGNSDADADATAPATVGAGAGVGASVTTP